MSRSLARPSSEILTLDEPPAPAETVVLRLKRKAKKVTWKEGTVDNEFFNRKSSKKCCIFHRDKPFDEDHSDDDEGRHEAEEKDGEAGPSGCCSRRSR